MVKTPEQFGVFYYIWGMNTQRISYSGTGSGKIHELGSAIFSKVKSGESCGYIGNLKKVTEFNKYMNKIFSIKGEIEPLKDDEGYVCIFN